VNLTVLLTSQCDPLLVKDHVGVTNVSGASG